MNVMEQADLARRMIDDPLITIRRSELRDALYDYGETQYLKAKYARYHRASAGEGQTAEMYAKRWAESNDEGWAIFFKTINPDTFG